MQCTPRPSLSFHWAAAELNSDDVKWVAQQSEAMLTWNSGGIINQLDGTTCDTEEFPGSEIRNLQICNFILQILWNHGSALTIDLRLRVSVIYVINLNLLFQLLQIWNGREVKLKNSQHLPIFVWRSNSISPSVYFFFFIFLSNHCQSTKCSYYSVSPLTICSTAVALQMYSPSLQVAQLLSLGLQVPHTRWPFLQL